MSCSPVGQHAGALCSRSLLSRCAVCDVTCARSHLEPAATCTQVLEMDVDDVPWKDEIVTRVPSVVNSVLSLSGAPGWGIDVNEEALAKYATQPQRQQATEPSD